MLGPAVVVSVQFMTQVMLMMMMIMLIFTVR